MQLIPEQTLREEISIFSFCWRFKVTWLLGTCPTQHAEFLLSEYQPDYNVSNATLKFQNI